MWLIDRYRAYRAAAKFTKAIFDDYWPMCGDIEGSTVHDLGVKTGVIIETKYDPEIHGECEYDAEPGDAWYVLNPALAR